jgi:hypothetical protein
MFSKYSIIRGLNLNFIYIWTLFVMLVFSLFSSCDIGTNVADSGTTGGNGGTGAETTLDIVTISENIDTNQTWIEGKIYYIEEYSIIDVTATLTINPGCIVKVGRDSILNVKDGGKIVAQGTDEKKIFFTSYKAEIGGKLPDFPLSAERCDWTKISIQDSGSVFEFCIFEYGRTPLEVSIPNTTITIQDCLFKDNDWALIASQKPNVLSVFARNQFYSNRYPLVIHPLQELGSTNTFSSDDGSLINENQTIQLLNSSSFPNYIISSDIIIKKIAGIDYSLRSITLDKGVTLSLEDNVIVKIPHDGLWHLGEGASIAMGSNCSLTSTEDDSIGVNIDGEPVFPPMSLYHWNGIINDFTGLYVEDIRFKYSNNSTLP